MRVKLLRNKRYLFQSSLYYIENTPDFYRSFDLKREKKEKKSRNFIEYFDENCLTYRFLFMRKLIKIFQKR